jgi:hypothetical protein
LFLLVVLGLAIVTVPIAGGRLAVLADVHIRWAWMLPAALGVQIVAISVIPDAPSPVPGFLHVSSYALAAACLAANLRLPGLPMIALGGCLNLAAIAANGGVMPASARALAVAGLDAGSAAFENSAVVVDGRLTWLGDVFAIPAAWPLSNVFSIGDILIGIGLMVGVHRICRSQGTPPTREASAGGRVSA